ncbi:MAG: helix-turn-helix domain-containing protein [Clostridiales bacterium]|nr:helix-turn-helix domain-containing protein [Clostridiales bacterium]
MEQELAAQIRDWRKEQCLTQEKAAELLGLESRQYRRLEAGACYPSWTTLEAMGWEMNADLNKLILEERLVPREESER